MNILDNILSLKSYGLRYQLNAKTITNRDIMVQFLKQDYTGAVTEVKSVAGAGVLHRSFSDGSFFRTIAGSMYELRLATPFNDINYFREIQNANVQEFLVHIWRRRSTGLVIEWVGYIVPELYSQDFGAGPNVVSITATDGLGLLKDIKFAHNDGAAITGIRRVSDILSLLFYHAGLRDGYWWDASYLSPVEGETPQTHYGLFYNSFVYCDPYKDSMCDEVLTNLLSFNLQVVAYRDGYVIKNPKTVSPISNVPRYSREGAYIDSCNLTTEDDYGVGKTKDGTYTGRASLNLDQKVGKIKFTFERDAILDLTKDKSITLVPPTPSGIVPYHVIMGDKEIHMRQGKADELGVFPHAKMLFTHLSSVEFPALFNGCTVRVNFNVQLVRHTEHAPDLPDVPLQWRVRSLPQWGVSVIDIVKTHHLRDYSTRTINELIYLQPRSEYEFYMYTGYCHNSNPPGPWVHNNITIVYSNWTLTVNRGDDEFNEPIEINEELNDGPIQLGTSKLYGFDDAVPNVVSNRVYCWINSWLHLSKASTHESIRDTFKAVKQFQYKDYEDVEIISAKDLIITQIVEHFSENRIRNSCVIISRNDRVIDSLSLINDFSILQLFVLLSCKWDLLHDAYSAELIGIRSVAWILSTGMWDDHASWHDTEYWKDSPD